MAWWLFQNVVITAVLAAVVAAICRFARLGPVARHALWVLVLVKFVTPPLVVWPWAAPDPFGISRFDARFSEDGVVPALQEPVPAAVAEGVRLELPDPGVIPGAATIIEESTAGPGIWSWLLTLWIAGSVVLLIVESVRVIRLVRRLRHAAPADPAIVARATTLSAELGLRAVPIYQAEDVQSPFVACIGRPKLIWPAGLHVEDTCLDGLLVHELAHVKRRDHVVGWIELAAGVLWWWNPLFWSVRSALREQAELACDAWVISALPNGRRAYAESLLALSSLGSAPSPSIAAVVGARAGNRRVLERRLVMIMKGRAPLRLPWAGLVTLIFFAVAALPAWATDGQTQAATQVRPAAQKPRPTDVEAVAVVKPAPVATVHTKDGQTHTIAVKPTLDSRHTVKVHPSIAQPVAVQSSKAQQRALVFEPKHAVPANQAKLFAWHTDQLPEDGQKILKSFETDRDAIQAEADAKMAAKRDEVVKKLEALQEQYAKAGKLDEAIAIRDYLRAGGPNAHQFFSWIKR